LKRLAAFLGVEFLQNCKPAVLLEGHCQLTATSLFCDNVAAAARSLARDEIIKTTAKV
jgi:hypothetical protein